MKDEARQKSKGFAFIQYTSQDAALLALESMDYQVPRTWFGSFTKTNSSRISLFILSFASLLQMFEERRVFVELAKPRNHDFGGNIKTTGPPQQQILESKDGVDEWESL